MAAIQPTWFRDRDDLVFQGGVPWASGTLKVALVNASYTFDATVQQNWADISAYEITATGYTAGGQTIAGKSRTDTGALSADLIATDSVFTASTGGLTAAGAIVYETTNTRLLFYVAFGSTYSISSGETLTIDWTLSTIIDTGVAPANPNLNDKGKRLLNALSTMTTGTTKRVLSGIHYSAPYYSTPGGAASTNGTPNNQIAKLAKPPAILNFDFAISATPANLATQNQAVKAKFLDAGHVIMATIHPSNPQAGSAGNYQFNVAGDYIGNVSGSGAAQVSGRYDYATDNQCNFTNLTTPGHDTYNRWFKFLAFLADAFEELQSLGVTVVFRPFHEMNCADFWWSYQNPTVSPNGGSPALFRLAWQQLFTYMTTTRGLNNIIWLFHAHAYDPYGYNIAQKVAGRTWPTQSYYGSGVSGWENFYPGDAYADIIGLSCYDDNPTSYDEELTYMYEHVGTSKLLWISEIGNSAGNLNGDTLLAELKDPYVANDAAVTPPYGLSMVGAVMWWCDSAHIPSTRTTNWATILTDPIWCHAGELVY